MKIVVVGTGYVGLVTGAGFAELGHHVTCIDVDAARVARLRAGEIPIHEPGLDVLVARNCAARRLTFTTSAADAVPGAQIALLAVGTPSRRDGSADLRYIADAARSVGRALDGFCVIVTKSTVPVGTADWVRELVAAETDQPFVVASSPEFLKEGDAIADFLHPARIVIGVDDERAAHALREAYGEILRTTTARLVVMDVRSAELTKYAANAMLATRISFMNELARLAEASGADIEAIREGIGADPRIGPQFLRAGAGFGGSCFPKDLRALVHSGRERGVRLSIVAAADRANERQQRVLGQKVIAHFGGRPAGKRIAVWGLAFKPDTDDIRESPALVLIDQLRAAGATIAAYDPAAMPNVRAQLGAAIELADDPYAAADGADALVLVTDWLALRTPDLDCLARTMRAPLLFDGRNAWSPEDARRAGFTYVGIGRGLDSVGATVAPRQALAVVGA
jgi:UDPglucose 6-dehydrogenase